MQLLVDGELARFQAARPPIAVCLRRQRAIAHRRAASALPGPERFLAPIPRPAVRVVHIVPAVVIDFAFDRAGRPTQPPTDRLQRLTATHTEVDLNTLVQAQAWSRTRCRWFDKPWFHPASVTEPAKSSTSRHADRYTGLRSSTAITDKTPELPNNRCQRWKRHSSTPRSKSAAVASTPRTQERI